MLLSRVKDAVGALVGSLTDTGATTGTAAPAREPTGSMVDPGPARREPVLALLDANGGRVWQQDVVGELDCSAATVSRLLSGMEADDEITRYWKHGRKVVAFPTLGPEGEDDGSEQHGQRAA